MAQTSRSADLTSGPMLQKIILFSIPLAASSILQLLFNAADVVVVGRFAGSTALAAVGSNGSLINLLVICSWGFRWAQTWWPHAVLVQRTSAVFRTRCRPR